MTIIDRATAKARGLTRYFTGKPCVKGHIAERNTSNSSCAECARLLKAKWKMRKSNADN